MSFGRLSRAAAALDSFFTASFAATPFTDAFVDTTPDVPGVYFLYRHGRIIYVGIAVRGSGIRQELTSHLQGAYGACTRAATTFDYEVTRDPVVASRQYLRAHMARHGGRLPPCNEPES